MIRKIETLQDLKNFLYDCEVDGLLPSSSILIYPDGHNGPTYNRLGLVHPSGVFSPANPGCPAFITFEYLKGTDES